MTKVYVSQPPTNNDSNNDAMFSSTKSKPQTYSFFTHIILRLNGENTNLAKVSLDVKKAKNVTVYLYNSKRSEIKKVSVSIFMH